MQESLFPLFSLLLLFIWIILLVAYVGCIIYLGWPHLLINPRGLYFSDLVLIKACHTLTINVLQSLDPSLMFDHMWLWNRRLPTEVAYNRDNNDSKQ